MISCWQELKIYCISVTHTVPGESAHTGCYIYNLYIYLHVIQICLKVTIAIFYFCHSKNPANVMKNILNSTPIYFWKKCPY